MTKIGGDGIDPWRVIVHLMTSLMCCMTSRVTIFNGGLSEILVSARLAGVKLCMNSLIGGAGADACVIIRPRTS